jgi:two-component system sensor histidine kinase CiaH
MLLKKKRLAVATAVYWVLLAYIIVGLCFWFSELQRQSGKMAGYQVNQLRAHDPQYVQQLAAIRSEQKNKTAQYVGEGSTFLLLILLGAIFVYREVRRQIRLQQQQQNFMMAVTHELKTPIAVTKLNLETLRKHKLDEQKQAKMIQAALQETNRLDILANNILIASQLEGGEYIQIKELIDLSAMAERCVRDYRNRFPGRKWEQQIVPDCMITGDPLLLQLLVGNLLENALKYSPGEAPITLILAQDHGHTFLSVKDEGPGIPDTEKKKIFRKFYRSGQEATRQTKGTGLGLYLCRKIADDQHATLKVADNSPSGSIFTLAF